MARPQWAPDGINLDIPSAARMYDYFLGGSHNFAAVRAIARKALTEFSELPVVAQANRAFLGRAVRWCVSQGIRQFLDIGSGIPTVGNVHTVAQQVDPRCRVAYVDIDPVAVSHSQAILDGNPQAAAILADLRDPEVILNHSDVNRLINFQEPVAVLLVAVLHFISDDDGISEILATIRDRVAVGSYLVISHVTDEGWPEEGQKITEIYKNTSNQLTIRNRSQIARFFDGFALAEPGMVSMQQWHPDPLPAQDQLPSRIGNYAGVGRKG